MAFLLLGGCDGSIKRARCFHCTKIEMYDIETKVERSDVRLSHDEVVML